MSICSAPTTKSWLVAISVSRNSEQLTSRSGLRADRTPMIPAMMNMNASPTPMMFRVCLVQRAEVGSPSITTSPSICSAIPRFPLPERTVDTIADHQQAITVCSRPTGRQRSATADSR